MHDAGTRMAVPLVQFVKHLEDSGILASDTLQDFLPPQASPENAEDLARELVRKKKLTKFQAQEAYKGRARSLLVGNYTILDTIGAGGMGQVFKAQHRRMKRIVAIKMLPTGMMKNPAVVARFEREVTAAAKLNHPNIVTAYDADNADGVHLLIMEYVEGSDLSVLVKKNGPLPVDQAVNYILQTARGLEAAHAEGIVHRDIKPANLLLDKKGTVKILDMGLARLNADADSEKQAELTNTGTIMGTVDYMAPEQALNTKTADARADIYSLGCSLFYLLTSQAIYSGDTLMAKLLAHRDQPIPSIHTIRPDVPEQVEAVFRRMVAKSIEDRYLTMTAVIADLERLTPGQSPSFPAQPSSESFAESGLTDFLRDISLAPAAPVKRPTAAFNRDWIDKNKRLLLVGGGALGALLLLAAIVVSLTTKDFEIKPKGTESTTAKRIPFETKPVVSGTKTPLAFETVEFDQWMKEVATLTAAQQVEAVARKLQELNPGFDGKVTHQGIWDITDLEFLTDNVTDISPVRALVELKSLGCWSPTVQGKVSDLSPLKTMKLTRLNCKYNPMISDLTPLQGMALTSLDCDITKVADLSPLKGMPLTALNIGRTGVADLSTLRGMPLTYLWAGGPDVSDLSPLAGMKLMELAISGTRITDLSFLKGMPLNALHIRLLDVFDLSPLQGMPLKYLDCIGTKVVDLSPLKGMPLEEFFGGSTQVSDLLPLQGMPLTHLDLSNTPVSDISPLREMKLTGLQCGNTRIADLSPLKDMPLKDLQLDIKPFRDTDLLRSIKTLATINGKSAAEFWKEVEQNQATFAAWTKQVAAAPAERQVEAVAKKLQELNPGFDGKVTPTIEGGVVTELVFLTDNVTDLSPVRALKQLNLLTCGSSGSDWGHGKLADLSPLRGMRLTALRVWATQVTDLSPLQGMPLTHLDLWNTPVSDISPLKEMKLTGLQCGNTRIADLSPLQGMPLTTLICVSTQVSDLSPLRGMPLTRLSCDFKPIRDTELLRSLTTLTMINDQPAAEFWKDVEK
jgi:serine/threonine-protein kinase